MKSKHEIYVNPDGHGGVIKALCASGGMDLMKKRGIKYIFHHLYYRSGFGCLS